MKMNAIEVEHLTMRYKDGKEALRNCNFTVKQGEVFALLGENGAGKSSLVHILTTFLYPTSGSIRMMGKSLQENQKEIRMKTACVAQKPAFDDYLSLEENLVMQASLYHIKKEEAYVRSKELIHMFQLEEYMDKNLRYVSGGVKRKVDIAMSMMSKPAILFLDEPTVGLDIIARGILWDVIRSLRKEYHTTIFLTTHYLEEAQALSDTICFLKEGSIYVQAPLKQLQKDFAANWVEINVKNDITRQQISTFAKGCTYIEAVREKEMSCCVQLKEDMTTLTILIEDLQKAKLSFQGIAFMKPSLDELFIKFALAKGVC